MKGFIMIPRDLSQNELLMSSEPFDQMHAFLDLIIHASHKERSFRAHNLELKLERGEVATSLRTLARRWNRSLSYVVRTLKKFTRNGFIELKAEKNITIIRIMDWQRYQGNPEFQKNKTDNGQNIPSEEDNNHSGAGNEASEGGKEHTGMENDHTGMENDHAGDGNHAGSQNDQKSSENKLKSEENRASQYEITSSESRNSIPPLLNRAETAAGINCSTDFSTDLSTAAFFENGMDLHDLEQFLPLFRTGVNTVCITGGGAKRSTVQECLPPPKKRKYQQSPDEVSSVLSAFLLSRIRKNNPYLKVSPESAVRWKGDFGRMITVDGVPPEELRRMIAFSQKDQFWMKLIVTPYKLKVHFHKLYLDMKSDEKKRNATVPDAYRMD